MVYFTCNACGEQVKKPMVEKHYQQKCRNCNSLTCIDCLKDFIGDDYKSHVSCMSEEQRYSKEGRSGWDPTVGQGNKGEKRQNQWTENLRKILAEATDLDGDVRNILDTIQEHDNIPRKKPKFVNFVKNIMRNRARPHSIDKTWELFEQALKPPAVVEAEPMDTKEEEEAGGDKDKKKKSKKKKKGEEEIEDVKEASPDIDNGEKKLSKKKQKKKDRELADKMEEEDEMKENEEKTGKEEREEKKAKKRKRDEVEDESTPEPSSPKKTKFDWDELITGCLKTKEGHEMKLVKLKKKCLSEFFSQHEGTHKTKEEVGAKFDKKLKKRSYRLLKDKVKLITEDEDDEEVEQGAAGRPEGWKSAPEPAPAAPAPGLSFNKWEGADMGSSAQTDKFRRLMGIKSAPKPQEVKSNWGRDDKKMLRDLEQGFEKARETHFGGRSFTM